MAILSSQATRRDAKSYFGRFGKQESGSKLQSQPALSSDMDVAHSNYLHIAIIKLCHADSLSSVGILPGLAKTFVQLGRLGMRVCLVVEPEESYSTLKPTSAWSAIAVREKYESITNRIVEAIEAQGGRAQPILGELFAQVDSSQDSSPSTCTSSSGTVAEIEQLIFGPPMVINPAGKQLFFDLMQRGQIPVIAPVAGGINPSLLPISADSAVYQLCNGISPSSEGDSPSAVSVERVIIIDPIGGLPAAERHGGSHLYINLRQEYDGIVSDISSIIPGNEASPSGSSKLHLRNLVLMKMCLAKLNATSSGLITTPTIASASPSQSTPQSLIHNLLTDKPLVSPSLPARRSRTPISNTTLLRSGLPVTVYKSLDPTGGDANPLDLPRLVQLIEDSFGRRLDVDHYFSRIRDKLAAVIVAGDYEGAAVVTKENSALYSTESWVPYLDKFAVSTKSQGSGGVADIVFNVLVATFPDDLIWRSRKTNPVNKWVRNCIYYTNISISKGREAPGSCLGLTGVCFGHQRT